MRNLMIFAAILIGLGTFMAQMADKMSPAAASATAAPRTASPATVAPASGRTLSIARDARGHFQTDGRIEGQRIDFMVDTGASTVTVGQRDAERIGLPPGAPANFHTAAGTVEGAMVRGRQVAAACLAVDQITVAVSPPMNGPALLGQNFLRRFEMVVDGREMTLRPRAER